MADGAAFGSEIESVLTVKNKNITLFFPESFEWIVLKPGIVKGVEKELDTPEEYIESSKYFSYERFFADLLTTKTKDTYLAYSKKKLNSVYLHENESNNILENIPLFDKENK